MSTAFIAAGSPRVVSRAIEEYARAQGHVTALVVPWESDAATLSMAVSVRSHLRAHPPLPTAEYLALKQSVAELRAVGRNLNQIARLMNQGGVPSPSALTGELAAVKKLAPDLRDRVLALVEANERSWLAGDGKLGAGNGAAAARFNSGLGDKRKH